MNQRVLIVLFTAVVFAAGFGARLWTEKVRPVSAPPVVIVSSDPNSKAAAPANRGRGGPSPADIVANAQRWSAESEVFRKGVEAIENEFLTSFAAILTPKQLEVWTENQRRFGARPGNNGRGGEPKAAEPKSNDPKAGEPKVAEGGRGGERSNEPRPLSEAEIENLRRQPLFTMTRMLSVANRLEDLTRTYVLDERQQQLARVLLIVRRDKFIALTEPLSAMSITYSALARDSERLAATVAAKATEPRPEAVKSEAPKPEPGK